MAYFEQEYRIGGIGLHYSIIFSENERTLRQVHFSLCSSNKFCAHYNDKAGLKFIILNPCPKSARTTGIHYHTQLYDL